MNRLIALVLCLLFPLMVGGLSAYLSANGVAEWYPTLVKPMFNPPAWLFGPVWTVLYLLMGYSFYRIWMQPVSIHRRRALQVFAVQLILNFLWSLLFFRWHLTGLATFEIILLWFAILIMIKYFIKIDPAAGYLQIPYMLWVAFAMLLCASLWYLNS